MSVISHCRDLPPDPVVPEAIVIGHVKCVQSGHYQIVQPVQMKREWDGEKSQKIVFVSFHVALWVMWGGGVTLEWEKNPWEVRALTRWSLGPWLSGHVSGFQRPCSKQTSPHFHPNRSPPCRDGSRREMFHLKKWGKNVVPVGISCITSSRGGEIFLLKR